LSAFVRLPQDLGATVIAEGVEGARDLAVLSDLGVDAAQGYLLGKPSIQPDDLKKWVEFTIQLAPQQSCPGSASLICVIE
jgi:EAL domain-containing protein (putative c-di-GMP-specific phosphodiesterase class I)